MDLHPLVIQSAFAIPIFVGLVLYILLRWDRTPLNLLVAGLLSLLAPWLCAQVVKLVAQDPAIRSGALDVEMLVVALMPPLFVVAMGHFARIAAFEQSWAASAVVMVLPVLFSIVYFIDGPSQLVVVDRAAAIAGAHPRVWAGPLFWALQIWCGLCDVAALSFCFVALWRARSPVERHRAAAVILALMAPILAHFIYTMEWQPFDYSLAPASLGLTAVLFSYGVRHYGILEAQPIVRRDVIEHLRDGLVLSDTEGTVLDANAAAESILGVGRDSLRGRRISEVLALLDAEEDAGVLGARIDAIPLDGGHLGTALRTRDGRVLEVYAGAVRARGYEPAGRVLALTDRSQQHRAERLLRERQKLESVGILAAGVAHEVNNPLAYVRSNLIHLQNLVEELEAHGAEGEKPEVPGDMPEILAESLEGLDRIGKVVKSMLRFSRVSEESLQPVDVNRVVDEALRLAELHRNRSVEVAVELSPDLPPVRASFERLVQVLLNLFLNGKQALADRPGARIVAQTDRADRSVIVRVSDNGPGILEEHRASIFDPFFTTRPPDEGTGLGLAIAFDIVREHGGTLEVESRMGEGTCFTVRLPMLEV